MSVSVLENRSWDGFEMIPCASNNEEATHVEKAADEPRPAPIGRFADAVNVTPGLPHISLVIPQSHGGVGESDLRVFVASADQHVEVQESHGGSQFSLRPLTIINYTLDRSE